MIKIFWLSLITLSAGFVHAASTAVVQTTPATFFGDVENFKSKSLSLQTEKQNLEATSDLYLSKKFFWTPKLSVSANSTQTKLNSNTSYDANYIEADLSLNLFRGGGDWNSMKDASAQNKAQELQVFNEALRVEAKAADLIFKSLYLIETERIQDQLLKLKEESLRIVNDRFHQGRLPLQEVAKSEVDLTQQKNKLRSAHLDFVENKSQISSLFVNDLQTKAWPFTEKVSPRLPTAQRLPLVEQKYWASESREQAWKSTKAGHWPSLDFTLQYLDTKVKDPTAATSQQYIGLLTLSLPIWNRYETAAQVSSAYAQFVASANDLKDTEQSLKQKTFFLKEKIEIARVNLSEAKKNVEASRKLYQDILRSFRLGRLSTNDLLIEQNRLLDSENSLALSQLTFHQGLIETCVLAGYKTSECLQ